MSFDIKSIRLDQKHIGLARQASPFLRCFWSRLVNLISKDTDMAVSIQTPFVTVRTLILTVVNGFYIENAMLVSFDIKLTWDRDYIICSGNLFE